MAVAMKSKSKTRDEIIAVRVNDREKAIAEALADRMNFGSKTELLRYLLHSKCEKLGIN